MPLEDAIRSKALSLGFDACRLAPADAAPQAGARLAQWLEQGAHGDMAWMADTAERRASPRALWPQARSLVMLGANYGPEGDPLAALERRGRGAISVYARNRDYHDLVKGRLKQLAGFIVTQRPGAQVKVFVDTAPVMEKPLAQAAGLGWQGKHTNLVSTRFGSWLFLGSIFTDLELAPDAPGADHCGSCSACLDACPTQAFPAPYRLDARRCIAYLTIENKGPIPREFRAAIGNRVYGCDDCLAVCPWNKFAKATREAKLVAREELENPALAELAALDDAGFRALFSGSPVKRLGHSRFLRNVLIAIGNSGDVGLARRAGDLLDSPSPLVRGAAVWALARLIDSQAFSALAQRRAKAEDDADVIEEWAKETQSDKN
ncbi:tRNA epoxyqueuosine(34) reductase QueG [Methylocystis heyeri]|uniref:Epoxyqueuosine reductase n=1 Tax=Methylocystis heyeri TaxID=391905 RepID=A0A6B8KDY0_9HYPH|nr:tRNA epoxyqueuosine(34) reductase QueG [Methylocystis heyeri]QGM45909.1 tRNA epoxyqueuosine(34) reductase QueG [Methylocystis heyeri]